jgi:hypothetical protein
MDQERRDYADLDLPPPRRWPWGAISVLLGIGLFVFIVVACVLNSVLNGPHFD